MLTGKLVGIIIGGLAVIALVAVLATRHLRKKRRIRRTNNRSSMFEPWPAPAPVALEEETYEKNVSIAGWMSLTDQYEPPTQSFPMQDQAYPAQGYSDHGAYPYAGYEQGYGYPPHQTGGQFGAYPAQGYDANGAGMAGAGAGTMAVAGTAAAGAAPAGNSTAAANAGLTDGSMVRVKVGFVRSLEDELGESVYVRVMF